MQNRGRDTGRAPAEDLHSFTILHAVVIQASSACNSYIPLSILSSALSCKFCPLLLQRKFLRVKLFFCRTTTPPPLIPACPAYVPPPLQTPLYRSTEQLHVGQRCGGARGNDARTAVAFQGQGALLHRRRVAQECRRNGERHIQFMEIPWEHVVACGYTS